MPGGKRTCRLKKRAGSRTCFLKGTNKCSQALYFSLLQKFDFEKISNVIKLAKFMWITHVNFVKLTKWKIKKSAIAKINPAKFCFRKNFRKNILEKDGRWVMETLRPQPFRTIDKITIKNDLWLSSTTWADRHTGKRNWQGRELKNWSIEKKTIEQRT